MERNQGCAAGCLTIIAAVVIVGLLDRSSDKPPITPPSATIIDPHRQREEHLTDLKAERQSKADLLMIHIGAEARIRRDLMIVRDPDLRKLDPFPNPNEERQLLDELNKIVKDNADSKAELDALDAEIAREEGQQQPLSAPVVPSEPQVPPTETTRPTSGVLCDGTVQVPQYGELVFKDLPGDRLRFKFDHDAWQPTIHRQPDGGQTLVMRSIKPGIQTKCDMRWELVQPMPTNVSQAQTSESQNSPRSPPVPLPAPPPIKSRSPQPSPPSHPVPIYRPEPEYSEQARRAKFNGDVRALITIDERGNVTSVTFLDSPGLGLDEKVVEAVSRWRFKPAMENGVPVTSKGEVTVTFRLL